MRPHHLGLGRVAVVAVGALVATTLVAMAAMSPGVTVEDQAGALASGAASSIQNEAAPFTSASIPVLVVIRRQASTADGVVQEAQDLMAAQSVESAPDGRDGIVVLLDLNPAGSAGGRGSIAVGQRLSSALPGPTLSSIYTQSMVPLLRNGDLAGAVTAALSSMSDRLDGYQPFTGDGTPGAATEQQSISWAGVIVGLVVVLLVMVGGIGLLLFLLRRRGRSRMPTGGGPGYPGYGPGYGGGGGIGRGGAAGIGFGGAAVGGIVGYELGRSQGGDDASAGSVGAGGGGWGGGDDASAGSVAAGGGDWGGGGGGDSGGGGGGGGDSGGGGGGGGGDS
jgi:hypothetical protein